MNRFGFDVLAATILALTAALGAYAPVLLSRRDRALGGNGRSLAYVLGNLFSAGVMVSAGLCHLLGEALRSMPPTMLFPLAPFLCGAGYMLTLVADRVAAHASGATTAATAGSSGGQHEAPGCAGCHLPVALIGSDGAAVIGAGSLPRSKVSDDDVESQQLLVPSRAPGVLPDKAVGGLVEPSGHFSSVSGRHAAAKLAADGAGLASPDAERQQQQPCVGGGALETDGSESSDAGPPGGSVQRSAFSRSGGSSNRHVTFITAVLMGVALCFHSLLEGAAMGAQQTISNSLHIFIAIVSHKGLAAYALGSSIVDSGADTRRFWSVILPFTLASPVGIFIGLIISDVAQGVGAASISALASGTFLYVAFMEVIPRELRDPHHVPQKLAALVLGFSLMSILAIWA